MFRATAVPNTFTAVSVGERKKLLRRTYNFVGRNHAEGAAGCRTGGSFDPAEPMMSIDVLFRYAKPEHLRLKGGALHPQFRCGAVGSGDHPADLPQNLQDVLPLQLLQSPRNRAISIRIEVAQFTHRDPQGLCPPSELLSVPENSPARECFLASAIAPAPPSHLPESRQFFSPFGGQISGRSSAPEVECLRGARATGVNEAETHAGDSTDRSEIRVSQRRQIDLGSSQR